MDKVAVNPSNGKYSFKPTDTALMAEVTLHSKEGTKYQARPVFYLKNSQPQYIIDTVFSQNVALAFTGLADGNKVELQVKESNTLMQYVTLKAYKFPFINLVWLGTLIMVAGFLIAMFRRVQTNKASLRKI